jgi:hypothetical protein
VKHNEGEGGVEARTQRTKRISTLAPRIAFPGFSAGLSVRLAARLRGAVSEESRVKGDLARIVLYALSHVDREKVNIMARAEPELTCPCRWYSRWLFPEEKATRRASPWVQLFWFRYNG